MKNSPVIRSLTTSSGALILLTSVWSSCAGDSGSYLVAPSFEVSSPAENAVLTNFEETFTGTCNPSETVSATVNSSNAYVVSATCASGVLTAVIGFRAGVRAHQISITNGADTIIRTVTFNKSCATNFVGIPGNTTLGTSDFCVGKYEAKAETDPGGVDVADGSNGGGGLNVGTHRAEIRETGTPWSLIGQTNAKNECLAMGWTLVSNAQWQTIARNIESRDSNWTTGTEGSGSIPRGNSSGSPTLEADPSDSNGCYGLTTTNTWDGSDPGDTCDGVMHINKRTHELTNAEVIWDIGGNVSEVMNDLVTGDITPSPSLDLPASIPFDDLVSCAGAACFPEGSTNRLIFAPLGNYNMTQNIGRVFAGNGAYGGAILRGGNYNANSISGIYTVRLNQGVAATFAQYGFRCADDPY